MRTKNAAGVEYSIIIALLVVIIAGNFIIDPPILFHRYGHFGIITHPIDSIKDLFFGWGYNQNSFIFSLKGLQTYFNMIFLTYKKYGFLKATFAYFTQFSPIWAFVPLKLLYDSCVEFLNNNANEEEANKTKTEGAENE